MPRLHELMNLSGLQVHKAISLRQQRPYWRKHFSLERVLMLLTPINVLLVCAHKVVPSLSHTYGPGFSPSDGLKSSSCKSAQAASISAKNLK